MVAKREIPATFLPPLMVASTGMVIGATGPAGSNVPRARVPEITMTFDMEKLRETSRKPEQYKPSVPMPNMSFHLALPEGWKFYGVMPLLEPELLIEETGEAGYFVLSQDVCSIFTPPDLTAPFHQSENFKGPAARFTIDVGWYPDGDPKGSYKCVVVTTDGLDYTRWEDHEGNPWAQPPIAEMETRSTAVVWRWMSETVSKIWNEHYRSR